MVKMDKRGQILSLDFLISIAAVVLAIGLIIQFSEIRVYNENEEMEWLELKNVAETAGELLVSHPDLTCELQATNNAGFEMMNCIDTGALGPAIVNELRDWLGISTKYGFSVKTTGISKIDGGPATDEVYTVKRFVTDGEGTVDKLFGGEVRNTLEIELSVWVRT